MSQEWLNIQSFFTDHELLGAINDLSISVKQEAANVHDAERERRAKEARKLLKRFFARLSELESAEGKELLLGKTSVSGELTPYVGQIIRICEGLRLSAQRNLQDLSYGLDETLNDILAATQSVTNFFEVVNTRLAAPVVRAKEEDRLGLLVLRFLHDSHLKTASLPFGLTDGSFAVYPTDKIPPIHLVPTSRQTTL